MVKVCMFWLQGTCRNGSRCTFSHAAQDDLVCPYFARGTCSYGARCKLAHTRQAPAKAPGPPGGSSSSQCVPARPAVVEEKEMTLDPSHPAYNLPDLDDLTLDDDGGAPGAVEAEAEAPPEAPAPSAWGGGREPAGGAGPQEDAVYGYSGDTPDLWSGPSWRPPVQPAAKALFPQGEGEEGRKEDRPLCSYFMAGNCFKGDACRDVHGMRCHVCQRFALHPFRAGERAAHLMACMKKQKAAKQAAGAGMVECGICLEVVLQKPKPHNKFGLLSCEHAFCLGCIRGWRSTNQSGASIEEAVRTCPICRCTSHFVTPSTIWTADPVERGKIIEGYKRKLKTIDCRHFARGGGTCPFGTSCFYRHRYADGTMEDPTIRKMAGADFDPEEGTGLTVHRTVRLGDYLFPDEG